MSLVKIPTAFRKHTDGDREVDIAQNNVADLLSTLAQKYPDLKTHLYDADGSLLSFCLLYTSPSPRDKRQSRMPSSA